MFMSLGTGLAATATLVAILLGIIGPFVLIEIRCDDARKEIDQ